MTLFGPGVGPVGDWGVKNQKPINQGRHHMVSLSYGLFKLMAVMVRNVIKVMNMRAYLCSHDAYNILCNGILLGFLSV